MPHPRPIVTPLCVVCIIVVAAHTRAAERPMPRVPDGYTIERVAAPPLVRHPVMAGFDERGRLFVAEPDGGNLQRKELEEKLPGEVRMLTDTDGDGVFDTSTVFVDKLTFPQGALWHDGALYVCSSGALWKFIDSDGDDKADQRIKLVGDFGYTGNAADVHGPFLGPDGRIWWCQGRHGHEFRDAAGNITSKGKAARIFNCNPDGTDVQTWATGGMDNPVEIVFTPEGDVIGTCNLFYSHPRGDTLVHWVYGGVYPREDFVDQLSHEFVRTGPLLPEIHNFGHVAVSGLCRYRSGHFGAWEGGIEREGEAPAEPRTGTDASTPQSAARRGGGSAGASPSHQRHILFVTQFNTHKVVRVELEQHGSTYRAASVDDFLVSDDPDFHPTDVFEDADGSLLVIDTGGWFRIGCPVSQVAKPDVRGAIYRVRKVGGKTYDDPRGLKIVWQNLDLLELVERLDDPRWEVRDRALQVLSARLNGITMKPRDRLDDGADSIAERGRQFRRTFHKTANGVANARQRLALVWAGARSDGFTTLREDESAAVVQASLFRPRLDPWQRDLRLGTEHDHPAVRRQAAHAIAGIGGSVPELFYLARQETDPFLRHAIVHAMIRTGDTSAVAWGVGSDHPVVNEVARLAMSGLTARKQPSLTIDLPAPARGAPPDNAAARLGELESKLAAGDPARGRAIFQSEKTACATCHSVKYEPNQLGPDLSKIGAIRQRRDLLESILFPSASFARGYEPYMIETDDGASGGRLGVVVGEKDGVIELATGAGKVETVKREAITSIEASQLSIMPAGIDKALSEQELADLLAYLMSLK